MAVRRSWLGRLAGVVAILVLVGVTNGCTPWWRSAQPDENLAASDVPLLVPADPRFADTFIFAFDIDGTPNNYAVSSNTNLRYDPAFDPDLALTAAEVNDRTAYLAGMKGAVIDEWYEALVALFAAADAGGVGDGCRQVVETPVVLRCEYPSTIEGSAVRVTYYRKVDNVGGGTEIVMNDFPATIEFLTGEFIAEDIHTAAASRYDP